MNQKDQYPQRYDDEISLVDLATTFIRRRRVFYAVFALVVVVGLGFVFLKKEVPAVSYNTMIHLAELPTLGEENEVSNREYRVIKDTTERVATVLATIDSRWWPEAQNRFREQGKSLSVNIKAEAVEGTELIRLITTGIDLTTEDVEQSHKMLAELITDAQNQQLANRVGLLKSQASSLDEVIASHGADSVVAAQAIDTRALLQQKIAAGEPASVLSLARESSKSGGPSIKLVLALSVVLGLMLGILAAFMAEFISHVRNAMHKPDTDK